MDSFTFSTITALSELIVTVIVLYVIFDNLKGNPLRWKLLSITLAYEVFVNVFYMVYRAVVVVENHPEPLGNWVTLLGAFHGILSLIMLIGLIVMAVFAYQASKKDIAYFKERKALTYLFIGLWMISIASGEALYFAVWNPFGM